MKRIMFFFALLLTSATMMFAQRGSNGYHGGHRGGNGYQSNGSVGYNSGAAQGTYRYDRGHNGYNRGGTVRYNNGRNYRGSCNARGYVNTWDCAPRQRVIWEYSDCGRYKWRLTQRGTYREGRWVYRRGCRTWVEPSWCWNTVRRQRYCI